MPEPLQRRILPWSFLALALAALVFIYWSTTMNRPAAHAVAGDAT